MHRVHRVALYTTLLTSGVASSLLAGEFSLSGGIQIWKGDYTYQTTTTTFALTAGARYRAEKYSISLTVPLLFQNSELASRVGGMLLPHGDGGASMSGQSPRQGGMMMSSGTARSSSSFESGIGDLLMMGNVRVAEESDALPSLDLTGQVKVPIAGAATAFSTGKWDYGAGIAVRKELASFAVFADLGKLIIGDPGGVDYHDPVSYGAGVGKVFADGTYSAMLYYQAYTRILDGHDPPQQVSLGFLYQSSPSTVLSLMGSIGLSNTVPGIGIAVGVDVKV
jgi:hypothetical protein